ncbi:MAG: MgtC/SapB family protein [Acidimicrobiia bacterium]|nr:MgtC/SapB family protein [Acidimicrobiia bacterium]
MVRFALAVALGAAVGLERESRNKIAGVRTHALVALGAAIFASAGAFAAVDGDGTRVAAQVASGIGFIGAGAIVQGRGSVSGVTTAATLWVSAALGLVSAFGMYSAALTAGLATLIVVTFLGYVAPVTLRKQPRTVELVYRTGMGTLGPVVQLISEAGGKIHNIDLHDVEGLRTLRATVRGLTRTGTEEVLGHINRRDEIISAAITEDS